MTSRVFWIPQELAMCGPRLGPHPKLRAPTPDRNSSAPPKSHEVWPMAEQYDFRGCAVKSATMKIRSASRPETRATQCRIRTRRLVARDARRFVAVPLGTRHRRNKVSGPTYDLLARVRILLQKRLQRRMLAHETRILHARGIFRDLGPDTRITCFHGFK